MNDDPWSNGGLPLLNVAATCGATRALGPGLRAVVWVQGCPFRCAGCIAPDWIPRRIARLVTPQEIVDELLKQPKINGLTFSGGEPMLQAAGLAEVIRLAREKRALNLICFSGFRLEQLQSEPPGPGVDELLEQVDLLIDGVYVERLNDNHGLRGSSNQRFHFLTDRLASSDYDFVGRARQAEIYIETDSVSLVGVPPQNVAEAYRGAVEEANAQMKPISERMETP